MSNDDRTPGKVPPKKRGIPTAGLIAVAVAAILSFLVYNFYTPAPTSSTGASSTTTAEPATGADATTAEPSTQVADAPAGEAATPTTSVATATPAAPPEPDVAIEELMKPGPLPDIVVGDANAPVTIVEYASMTCPHCAHFHTHILPQIKAKYIDTGKAKLIFREFPLDNLATGVAMLARCSGPQRYNAFIATMFKSQPDWATGEDSPLPKLKELSKQAGFSEDEFNKCLENEQLQKDILEIRNRADEHFDITGTPTFFLNGVKLKGGFAIEDFDKVMTALGHG